MLPQGYQQSVDPSSGKTYYINMMTGETSWTPPPGMQQAAAPPPAAMAPPSAAGLPPGWEERTDPTSGRKFYIDHINKNTSWEFPTAAASSPSYASAPRPAAAAVDRDAELARELAAQWEQEDTATRPGQDSDDDDAIDDHGVAKKKQWASDALTTNCFLTGIKFNLVQRKHHCRYCGQIFVSDVCKKTTRIPTLGFNEPVRRSASARGPHPQDARSRLSSDSPPPLAWPCRPSPLSLSPPPRRPMHAVTVTRLASPLATRHRCACATSATTSSSVATRSASSSRSLCCAPSRRRRGRRAPRR